LHKVEKPRVDRHEKPFKSRILGVVAADDRGGRFVDFPQIWKFDGHIEPDNACFRQWVVAHGKPMVLDPLYDALAFVDFECLVDMAQHCRWHIFWTIR